MIESSRYHHHKSKNNVCMWRPLGAASPSAADVRHHETHPARGVHADLPVHRHRCGRSAGDDQAHDPVHWEGYQALHRLRQGLAWLQGSAHRWPDCSHQRWVIGFWLSAWDPPGQVRAKACDYRCVTLSVLKSAAEGICHPSIPLPNACDKSVFVTSWEQILDKMHKLLKCS